MSVQADAPPLPPPKDIPATLRLGTNLLGLGIGPFPDDEQQRQRDERSSGPVLAPSPVIVISSSSSPGQPPKPTHFIPLRTTSPEPLTPPPTAASRNPRPDSPSTPRSDKHNNGIGERYRENSKSSSTVSLGAKSTCTVTPNSPCVRTTGSTSMLGRSPSREWGWKRGGSSSECIDSRPSLGPSVSFNAVPVVPAVGRKRSSGQLLSGFGIRLGRMGSVMRRNTSDAIGETPSNTPEKPSSATRSKTWRRKGKGKEAVVEEEGEEGAEDGIEGRWPSLKTVAPMAFDEGDAGITRPYNVEHDLHVSPSLEDLPPAWLETLRAQGLTEQDLMLIASARKRQQAVTNHAISTPSERARPPHASEPPNPIDSLPVFVGGSGPNLVSGNDEWRRRGTSTPETGMISFKTSQDAFESKAASLLRPDTSDRLLKRFSFEPSSTAGSILGDNASQDGSLSTSFPSTHAEAMSSGGQNKNLAGSTRTPNQLEGFSQLDVGGAEGWAASLLSEMNGRTSPTSDRAQPTPNAPIEYQVDATPTSIETGDYHTPAKNTLGTSGSSGLPKTGQVSNQKPLKAVTCPFDHAFKRLSIAPSPSPAPPVSGVEALITRPPSARSSIQSWSSPRPPRRDPMLRHHSAKPINPTTPSVSVEEVGFTPRKSSDSFGVHYSQSKSSVELDLVTPSSSSHPDRRPSPPSSDEGEDDEDIGVNDSGSILDFAGALREAGFDHTPGSSVSKELKEYLPGLFDTPSPSHRLSRRARQSSAGDGRYTPRSQHDMAYSVPASVSSCMASRSASPDVPNHTSPQARSPLPPTTKEERSSAAYSLMSSDSGHLYNSLHEATVQTAYTKVLGNLREEAGKEREAGLLRRSSGVDRIREESDEGSEAGDVRTDEDGRSEAGHSAIHALDEAARLFADVHS